MHKNKVYYLGIEDKNGNELNSNSIIKYGKQKGSVFYSTDECRFKIKWEDGFIRDIDKFFINQVEIIWYDKKLKEDIFNETYEEINFFDIN